MRVIAFGCAVCAFGACTGQIVDPPGSPGSPGDDDGPADPTDPVYGMDHPRIYIEANRDRLTSLLGSGDAAATRFQQIVDSQMAGGDVYAFSPAFAALMGQLSGNTTYCTWAVAQEDTMVAGQEATIASGGVPAVAADSYLYVGPTIGDLMLTYDWCFDQTSDSQRARWLTFAAQSVWNVWHPDQAQWNGTVHAWSGWSIDNPSNNYYYSFLRATMLFGLAAHDEQPDAKGWLDFFRVTKFEGELVPAFESDLQGGGSREGTGYGSSMMNLWQLYDLWQSSTGEDLARQTTQTRASLLAMMHAIVPTRDRFAPTGDQSRDSSASMFDYQRDYLQELAYLFHDDPLAPHAKWDIDHSSVPRMGQGFMAIDDFLYETPSMTPQPLDTMGTVYYAPGIGEIYARSSWDTDATWVNLIAGPYTESHAHRDQGHLMVFDQAWLAYDENASSHSGINQEEEQHNLVRITQGGSTVTQVLGTTSTVTALHRGTGWVHMAADLTPAYRGKAAVTDDEREVVFLEPDCVVVFDRLALAADASATWQLNAPTAPSVSGAVASYGGMVVTRVVPASATTSVKDWAQSSSEFTTGTRLDETVGGGAQQFLHVLSMDGYVTGAVRSDAGGRIGVSLTFKDGHTATVRFSDSGVDGTLQLDGGSEVSLRASVDAMPE
jgi:hypothetical protein